MTSWDLVKGLFHFLCFRQQSGLFLWPSLFTTAAVLQSKDSVSHLTPLYLCECSPLSQMPLFMAILLDKPLTQEICLPSSVFQSQSFYRDVAPYSFCRMMSPLSKHSGHALPLHRARHWAHSGQSEMRSLSSGNKYMVYYGQRPRQLPYTKTKWSNVEVGGSPRLMWGKSR